MNLCPGCSWWLSQAFGQVLRKYMQHPGMIHSQLLFADNSKLNLCLQEEKIFPHYPYDTGLKFWCFFSPCDVTEHCLQIWMCQLSLSWDAESHRRSRNESCSKKKESFALWVLFVVFCCLFVSWVLVFVSNSETRWCSAITPSQRVVGMLLIDFLVGLYFIWMLTNLVILGTPLQRETAAQWASVTRLKLYEDSEQAGD